MDDLLIEKINDMPRGWISESKLNARIYYMWKAMIRRTTQKYWEKFPTYTGTTVDNEWRKLSNFVKDIQFLDGYEEWMLSDNKMMMLDKDTIIKGNKHYSKKTCCFISHKESNIDVHNRNPASIIKARSTFIDNSSVPLKLTNKKTGEVKYFNSMKEACRQLNLNYRHVWMIVSDKYSGHYSTKGWIVEPV